MRAHAAGRPPRAGAAVRPGDGSWQRALRKRLFTHCDVDALVGIDNHRGVFPIHRSVRFLLLTASPARRPRAIACRLGLDDPAAARSASATNRRTHPAGSRCGCLRRCSNACRAPDLAIPVAAQRHRPGDRRSGRRRCFRRSASDAGWAARVRPRAERHRRPRYRSSLRGHVDRACRSSKANSSSRFGSPSNAVRHTVSAADARRLLRSARGTSGRGSPTATWRAPPTGSRSSRRSCPRGCVSTHTVFCLRTPLAARGAVFPLRSVQQLRRELSRAPAGDDARDDGDGGAVADSDREMRAGGVPRNRRARPRAVATTGPRRVREAQRERRRAVSVVGAGVSTHPEHVPADSRRPAGADHGRSSGKRR